MFPIKEAWMPVSTPTIKYEKRNRIAYITLNRPEVLNALSRELSAGLREALEDFRDDRDALVAIMTGEGGRAFSAGMDLKERASLDAKGERRSPARRAVPSSTSRCSSRSSPPSTASASLAGWSYRSSATCALPRRSLSLVCPSRAGV